MVIPEPFGGMALLALIAVLTVVGVYLVINGKQSRQRVCVGVGVILAPWILLGLVAVISPGIDEWNPSIESDSAVWGTWEGDDYLIKLNPDSSFSAKLQNMSVSGTWKRMDWNLYLKITGGEERYMRFVENSGNLILLPDPPKGESPSPGPMTKRR